MQSDGTGGEVCGSAAEAEAEASPASLLDSRDVDPDLNRPTRGRSITSHTSQPLTRSFAIARHTNLFLGKCFSLAEKELHLSAYQPCKSASVREPQSADHKPQSAVH